MTSASSPTRIAVLGAGGRAGQAIVAEAVSRGHEVTAIVRDPERHSDLRHPNVTMVAGDGLNPPSIVQAATGAQALVSAVTPFTAPPSSFEDFDHDFYAQIAETLTHAADRAQAGRVVVVGLFATLRTTDGALVADQPELFPESLRPFAHAHAAGIERLHSTGTGLDWLVLAPPPALAQEVPSTGRYVLGNDTMNPQKWQSPLSYVDLAIAILDEVDHPTRRRELVAVYGS